MTVDPYIDPASGALRNRLGIDNSERLREVEAGVSFSALKGPSLRIVTARGDEHEVTPRSAG